ncbi:MAG: response regulator transcription factor [Turicibacter sp.]|nr:response regulator transcription factor [Turicibacter sp.]
MDIFVLEDNPIQRSRLEKIINELIKKNNIPCQRLFSTASPDKLLDELTSMGNYHLYFLDLEINDYTKKGLEIAQLIRAKDPYGTIVFVTTHPELAPKTFEYKVSALDFITKDQDNLMFKKNIEECLKIASEYLNKPISEDSFIFKNQYTKFQLPFSDILYFETAQVAHKINLITPKKTTHFYGRLSELEKSDERLFRCHRSFVVNVSNITHIDKKNKIVYLKGNYHCLVSQRYLKELEEKIREIEKR